MDVDGDDLTILKAEFGQSAFGGPSTLIQGFVRYVTSAAVGVPEPGSMLMVGMGLFALPLVRRRNETNSRK
jgi:hypothetical protein